MGIERFERLCPKSPRHVILTLPSSPLEKVQRQHMGFQEEGGRVVVFF